MAEEPLSAFMLMAGMMHKHYCRMEGIAQIFAVPGKPSNVPSGIFISFHATVQSVENDQARLVLHFPNGVFELGQGFRIINRHRLSDEVHPAL